MTSPPATLPPALLIGGEFSAVSAARSLAAMGVTVHAAGDRGDPVRVSKACSVFHEVPRGPRLTERYLEWLEQGPRGAVILPCDDESLEVVARHRAQLEEWGYRPVEADDDVLLAMLDKERTYELSRAAGVPTPETRTIRTRAEAEEAAAAFDYPCALKPLQSHLFAQAVGSITKKLYVAEGPDELLASFDEAQALGVDMLVTDIVPGGDEDFCSFYSYLLPDGTPLFQLTKHKLRQYPIGFGLTCYQETVWEPEVAAVGMAFFKGVGLRGVGNVEFKRDPRDGQWKIIECNHRFTLANEIIRLSGVDVPAIAYRRVVGLPVEPIHSYRMVRMWNPIEDVKALLQYRAAGQLTVWQWVRSLMTPWHFPMFRLSDPMPTVVSVGGRLPGLWASLRKRLAR
jgi:predicted ATP-grasp superfamily ATP-dependent carboligase